MSSGRSSFSADSDSGDEWAAPSQPLAEGNVVSAAAVVEAPAASAGGSRSMEAMDAVERDLAGACVSVLFELPNGETHPAKFFMGQSVAHMKALLEKERVLPYERTTLYLGDRMLFDPLSLSDLPFDPRVENHVKVEMTT
ncbi:hypothetical protein LSCM1_01899 [Leishmania martiniquensis]|uniref:Ubiquitin-like domain-containing protein n=1 Tax=Leishmania martiniquensis TaxID=1580590 RepID=A0A836H5Z4_9TRYP|nr:hypothetical protein LSCM1_01899 [Leishmania martiniquensis]